MKTNSDRQTVPISTRITKPMQTAIKNILVNEIYINTSDYLRDLIRKDLEKRKVDCYGV